MGMVWDTVDTDMVTTWARGPLMPNLRPHPKLMLMLPLPTMVDTMAVDTVTDTDIPVLTVMPTTTLARGLLMPNLKPMLMPLLMPTADTMAVDTDTVTDTDTTVKFLLNCKFLKPYFLSYN